MKYIGLWLLSQQILLLDKALLIASKKYFKIFKMIEAALGKRGARISLSTAYDEKYPPENIIDG